MEQIYKIESYEQAEKELARGGRVQLATVDHNGSVVEWVDKTPEDNLRDFPIERWRVVRPLRLPNK